MKEKQEQNLDQTQSANHSPIGQQNYQPRQPGVCTSASARLWENHYRVNIFVGVDGFPTDCPQLLLGDGRRRRKIVDSEDHQKAGRSSLGFEIALFVFGSLVRLALPLRIGGTFSGVSEMVRGIYISNLAFSTTASQLLGPRHCKSAQVIMNRKRPPKRARLNRNSNDQEAEAAIQSRT